MLQKKIKLHVKIQRNSVIHNWYNYGLDGHMMGIII
jgi:hypothetical protein